MAGAEPIVEPVARLRAILGRHFGHVMTPAGIDLAAREWTSLYPSGEASIVETIRWWMQSPDVRARFCRPGAPLRPTPRQPTP